jgi:hypothetical protein
VRRELGALEADRGVHVDNGVAGLVEQSADVTQEENARGVAPPGGSVREMTADVAQRRGAQQRVANGVDERVAVRMAYGALLEWDSHATQNQFSSWGEAVHIVADANAEGILNSEL